MNYNNGFGGYSNGRYFNTPAYISPFYQPNRPIEQPQPNGLVFNNIRYVNDNEMASYVVLPGNTDMIINNSKGIVQIKSADMVGNSFTRSFKIEEITEQSNNQTEQKQPEIDLSNYVKKDDLSDFIKVDALESFSKQLDDKLEKIEKKIKISQILEDK